MKAYGFVTYRKGAEELHFVVEADTDCNQWNLLGPMPKEEASRTAMELDNQLERESRGE